jgi:signal transduction histidine kinase
LTNIKDEYFSHAHMSGVKLKLEIEPNVPQVRGDLSLLKQAITNLVSNGIKYAPQSGDMYLRAEKSQENVIISVKDNGPGLSEEEQMRLFEKFYRVKQPGTEKVKGSGLGLAIVRSIAEKHGGRAGCYSQPGQGATFYIALPYLK